MPNFYIDNWWLISCPFSPEYPILYLLYPYPYDNMWLLIWLTLNLLLKRRRFHINFNFKLSFKVKHKKTIIFIQFDVLYRSLIWKPCSKQPMNVERNKNLHTHTRTQHIRGSIDGFAISPTDDDDIIEKRFFWTSMFAFRQPHTFFWSMVWLWHSLKASNNWAFENIMVNNEFRVLIKHYEKTMMIRDT